MTDDYIIRPLVEDIQGSQVPPFPADPASHNLPPAAIRVVGRAEIIDEIQKQVRTEPLVSIVGAGGIGKTTVALAVAEHCLGAFKDGVWFVDFAPLRDPLLVPNAIATATGLVVHSANIMAALCRFLRDYEILLVLDNCEHMVEAIATCMAQILSEAPGVHVVATSREPLHVAGECVHRLPGLATPADTYGLTAVNALTFPAIQLFVDRAMERLETFVLSDEDAPVVAEICNSLDGIALAIELAAMRVDVFGVKGLHKQLDDRFRLLAGRRAGLERHRTLAATLDWSYGLLAAPEAALLRAVSVFAGAFDVQDASAISSVSAADAGHLLDELVSKSLLSVDSEVAGANYRPMETTRAYCLEQLVASGEAPSVRLRHAEYVCALLERAASDWGQQASRDWGAVHGRYLDDLRAALSWTGADPAQRSLLIRLTAAGTLLWNHFSLTDESRGHLTRAIEELREAGSEGSAVEMNLQLALAGALLYTRGIVLEARESLQRALDIAIHRRDTEFQLRCLRMISAYELFSGDSETGIKTLETFISIACVKDPSAIPEAETHMGVGELFTGRLQSARQRMQRLYDDLPQDFNDARFARFQYSNSVNVMVMLSHALWVTGSPDVAGRMAAKAVEHGREARHELSLSIALGWACPVFFWIGRDEDCARNVLMLDELVERHGIVTWRPVATFCRGALASLHTASRAQGIEDLERAVAEFRAIRHMARLPYYMGVLAQSLSSAGRHREAEMTIREALEVAGRQNEQWCLPELIRIQALTLASNAQMSDRESVLLTSVTMAEKIGALSWQLRSATDLARLWQAQGKKDEAVRFLRATCDRFTDGQGSRDMIAASQLLQSLR